MSSSPDRIGSTAMEDYLEQISQLIAEKGYARVSDIAERLNISRASVTNMVKRLDAEGLVLRERYRGLVLTERGQEVADYIIRRHEILTRLLQLFPIDEETIHNDVEGMEHYISSPTMRVFEALVSELENSPDAVRRIKRKIKR
ncbi:MAG: transcriptional regulator MntR [Verrucomicrobiota bacterium JB023]|nr:transcriptional regulator MntR [Verrucomicrobiota bacterium JB023]